MHPFFEAIRVYVSHAMASPFASGGLILMVLGGATAMLRSIPGRIWEKIKGRYTTTVTIRQIDPLFDWVCLWLASQTYASKCRLLTAGTQLKGLRNYSGNCLVTSNSSIEDVPTIHLLPAHGVHAFLHRGIWVLVNRDSGDKAATPGGGMLQGFAGGGSGYESLFKQEKLTLTFATTDRKTVRTMLDEARALANPPGEVRTRVLISRYGSWQGNQELPCRDAGSIFLPAGDYDRIAGDIDAFYANESHYRRVGMPHRRSYLLTGLPGTGKTSLIRALAAQCKCSLHVLNLAEDGLTDSGLASLLSDTTSDRSFVVIEDIDSYFNGRTPKTDSLKVTFSGLLNAIDGVAACEGRVLFMTTNHRETLDPALIRPGRVDFEMEFTYATEYQIECMFRRFRPEGSDVGYSLFRSALADQFPGDGVTTAQVQQVLYAETFGRGGLYAPIAGANR